MQGFKLPFRASHVVAATRGDMGDTHQSVILVKRSDYSLTPWVVWMYNHSMGGCSSGGDYCADIKQAWYRFCVRSMRLRNISVDEFCESVKKAARTNWLEV